MKIRLIHEFPPSKDNPRNSEGAFLRGKKGEILFAYSRYHGDSAHDHAACDIALTVSYDEGESWSEPQTALDTPLDDRDAGIVNWNGKTVLTTFNNAIFMQMRSLLLSVDIFTPEEQEIIREYLTTFPIEDEQKYLGSLVAISEDGNEFPKFSIVPVTAPHGPIVLKDGTLFYVGGAFSRFNDWPVDSRDLPTGIHIIYTKDGESWTDPISLPTVDYALLCEPHAVECDDGRILIFARAEQYALGGAMTILYTYTDDRGKTFTPWKNLGIEGNVGPTHVIKLRDGRLLASYGKRNRPDRGVRAVISDDNGESWSEQMIIRADGMDWDLGYPCSVELTNGNILTVYYFKTPEIPIQRIHYTIWSV